ncbi:hypothetical protein ACFPRL_15590 [Pseudoclavibacter helvolus]
MAVHTPTPTIERRRRSGSSDPVGMLLVRSSVEATVAERITVPVREWSTPALCQSQLGMRRHCPGVSGSRRWRGTRPAGPGAASA